MSAGLHPYLLSGRIDTPAQLRVAATRMLEDGSALMNASWRALWLGTGTSVRSTPLAEAAEGIGECGSAGQPPTKAACLPDAASFCFRSKKYEGGGRIACL